MLQRSVETAQHLYRMPWDHLRNGGRPPRSPIEAWISLFPTAPMFGIRWFWADRIPDLAWRAALEGPFALTRIATMATGSGDDDRGPQGRAFAPPEPPRIMDVGPAAGPLPMSPHAPPHMQPQSNSPS